MTGIVESQWEPFGSMAGNKTAGGMDETSRYREPQVAVSNGVFSKALKFDSIDVDVSSTAGRFGTLAMRWHHVRKWTAFRLSELLTRLGSSYHPPGFHC